MRRGKKRRKEEEIEKYNPLSGKISLVLVLFYLSVSLSKFNRLISCVLGIVGFGIFLVFFGQQLGQLIKLLNKNKRED